jgi:hypothetical protein
MNKILIFISVSFLSILISALIFNSTKIISNSMKYIHQLKVENYKKYIDVDINKYYEKNNEEKQSEELEESVNEKRKLGNNLENASFIIDILLGFIFISLPLMHHYNIGKKFEKIIVIICCLCGILGLILTFCNYNGYNLKNEIIEIKNTFISILSSFKLFIKNKTYFPIENGTLNQKVKQRRYYDFLFNRNKENKVPSFMDIQNNEMLGNEDNDLVYRYSFLRSMLLFILLALNLGLCISGYYLYKNSDNPKDKEVSFFKKQKQKKQKH